MPIYTPKPWHDPWTTFPIDGSTVWVRRSRRRSYPVKAVWDLATLTWTSTTTTLTLSWAEVQAWRLL
jgi:hypothetical protein